MASIVHPYRANRNFSLSKLVEEVRTLWLKRSKCKAEFTGFMNWSCMLINISIDEKDTGFEVSPDEFEPPVVGANDQTDAIPVSSSSDSLSMSDEPDARASLPTPSDILVSYSTFPGLFYPRICAFIRCNAYYGEEATFLFSKHRLRFLARHPVWLLVYRNIGPRSWRQCCFWRPRHNVDDGEML